MTSNETPQDPQEEKELSTYVSPRLRSKIAGRYDEEEEEKGHGAMIAVIGLVVVIVVCGGLFLVGQQNAKKKAAGQAAEAAERAKIAAADSAATADSLMRLAAADSAARAQSTPTKTTTATKPAATSVPVAKAPAAGTSAGAPAETAPPAPSARYGIAVASFLFEDRANEEKTRLATATSLEANVVPKNEGGTTTYQVVLGSFDSRSAASSKGNELLSAGTVTESTVIKLKR